MSSPRRSGARAGAQTPPAAIDRPSSGGATPDPRNPDPRWELARQAAQAWTSWRGFVAGIALVAALLVLAQVYSLYRLAADVHAVAGYAVIAALMAAATFFVGVPAWRFVRSPSLARPPSVDLADPAVSPQAVFDRARYTRRYARALIANAEVDPATRPAIAATASAADALFEQARRASLAQAPSIAVALRKVEDDLHRQLAGLDAKVDQLIHREAVAIGAATAVSLNGTLDAFIVLWRNVNLIARIARTYHGRPDLRDTLTILRDVAAAVVLARAADDVSELAGEFVGGVLGRLGGVVAGPLMDGSVNAAMTLKLGHLAKARCRAFQRWTPETAQSAVVAAFERVRAETGGVVGELVKATGGLAAGVATAAGQVSDTVTGAASSGAKAVWSLLQAIAGKKAPPPPEGEGPRPVG